MSSSTATANRGRGPLVPLGARMWIRERPLVPLLFLLLGLIVTLELVRPGIVNATWLANTIKFAIPLAILAAAQTLAMLTGGIDLSVAAVASMAAYLVATQAPVHGPLVAVLIAFGAAALVGLVNGIGIGVFRVHPLIMTLAMTLVVGGVVTVYMLSVVTSGVRVPAELNWLSQQTAFGFLPHSLLLFVPLAALILLGLRRSGYGRLLYALGDNETAARLSGVRVWQVLIALYIVTALLAAVAGMLFAGLLNTASAQLVNGFLLPSVAAAVIGGTSIFGGRGGYAGSIVGAVILTVLSTLLQVLGMQEAVRQILYGAIILAVAAAYTRITEDG
ncbi:MAG TPA: ABC transporter permease [Candidatus Limnocylindria bacterium]|nr:ABC transporter permease [Candidatus Limnocylindria bacterium]